MPVMIKTWYKTTSISENSTIEQSYLSSFYIIYLANYISHCPQNTLFGHICVMCGQLFGDVGAVIYFCGRILSRYYATGEECECGKT